MKALKIPKNLKPRQQAAFGEAIIKSVLETMYTDGVDSVNFRWGEGNVLAYGEFTDRTTIKGKTLTKVMEFELGNDDSLSYKLIMMLDSRGKEVEFAEGDPEFEDESCDINADFAAPMSDREIHLDLERRLQAIAATGQ